jgi:catechol 2,3-dioxygenase
VVACSIDPATAIGAVTLSVADLGRSLDYYRGQIGLRLLAEGAGAATLGAGAVPLLHLREFPGARLVRRATGLYHLALRLPSRRDLARLLGHLAQRGAPIVGAADHLVSEALYLNDPDGHGVEVYRDRPRDGWPDAAGALGGASMPLDTRAMMAELASDEPAWSGLPASTDMGHIHLQVADIRAAEGFYLGVVGLARMAAAPGASFVGAGGYHHHIGMNTWAGLGVDPPPARAARLLAFELLLPNPDALAALLGRLRAAGIRLCQGDDGWAVDDPSRNRMIVRLRA